MKKWILIICLVVGLILITGCPCKCVVSKERQVQQQKTKVKEEIVQYIRLKKELREEQQYKEWAENALLVIDEFFEQEFSK